MSHHTTSTHRRGAVGGSQGRAGITHMVAGGSASLRVQAAHLTVRTEFLSCTLRRVHRFFATEKLTPALLGAAARTLARRRLRRRRPPPRAAARRRGGRLRHERVQALPPRWRRRRPRLGAAGLRRREERLRERRVDLVGFEGALPGRASDASELRDGARDDRFCEAGKGGWLWSARCGVDAGRISGVAGSGTCGRLTRALIAVRYELEASVATGRRARARCRRKAGAEVGRGAKPPFSARAGAMGRSKS